MTPPRTEKNLIQISILETPSPEMDATREKGEVLPAPEHRPWLGDPRIRVPMTAQVLEGKGHIQVHIDCNMMKRGLPMDLVTHELQYHLEKLNMSLSIIASQALDIPQYEDELAKEADVVSESWTDKLRKVMKKEKGVA